MSRIGVIGTGHIAAPMVRLLARKGHRIAVTRRSETVSAELVRGRAATALDAQSVLDASEIVFLCLRPHQAEGGLRPLNFRAGHRIISVMAGIGRDRLQDLCRPARDFTRIIPLGFLEQGGCPLAVLGDTALLESLFSPENPVVNVTSESALNAHFAICALVPGLLDLLATGAGWLAAHTGDAAGAEFYTTQLASGFLAAMPKDRAGRLAGERDALATPGTLSLQMTDTLRAQGAHDALRCALDAIGKRLEPT
ncbi:MAG: NAD(P)-binding domain-containing protein [Rhodobacteraceae bacterium]|nr:NAD(P)-binding domain-containing protein [Paracoccaceae bacterium]